MTEKDREKHSNLRCYAHLSGVLESLTPITETSWTKFRQCVQIWKDLDGKSAEIARCFLQENGGDAPIHVPNDGGFHRKCYQYFTDSSKQRRAVLAKQKRDNEPVPAAEDLSEKDIREEDAEPAEKRTRMLRSSSALKKEGTLSLAHILPRVCIVCRGTRYATGRDGKRNRLPLIQCELTDGGNLLKAAQMKKDEHLLLHIENKDCVAIEVRYHSVCYKDYTRCLIKHLVSQPTPDAMYSQAFKVFCKKFIDGRVINDKEVLRMSKIKRNFDKVVQEVENDDSSSYKTWSLKQRLKQAYPQLCFMKPNRLYESEFVYVDTLSTANLLLDSNFKYPGAAAKESESSTDSETDESEQLENPPPATTIGSTDVSTLRDRFSTALDIKKDMEHIPGDHIPWPPTSLDLTLDSAQQIVPSKLFNFLAWVVGCSDVPSDECVEVGEGESRRILAIAQDIIYMATKGKRAMPKHISLAMAVRHLTGSAQLIGLLNGFGHCVSHSSVLELDTALAQQEIQKGKDALPSCLVNKNYTTLVWDNNDFGEETLSGKGTTHNTNGIAIQHSEPQPVTIFGKLQKQSVKKTRKRSLPEPDVELIKFGGAKKSAPATFTFGVALEEEQHKGPMEYPTRMDAAFYLTKVPQKRTLPAWTGFNQLLNKELLCTCRNCENHTTPSDDEESDAEEYMEDVGDEALEEEEENF